MAYRRAEATRRRNRRSHIRTRYTKGAAHDAAPFALIRCAEPIYLARSSSAFDLEAVVLPFNSLTPDEAIVTSRPLRMI